MPISNTAEMHLRNFRFGKDKAVR